MRPATLAVVLAVLCSAAPRAQSSGGFVARHEGVAAASPDAVYRVLVDRIGEWWDPAHTYSGDAANLSIDARPGGCFCERLPGGGGVEHMRVVYAAPGALLRLNGALGPLQAAAVTGTMTITLTAEGAGTRVGMSYAVSGVIDGGLGTLEGPVSKVTGEQLARLVALAGRAGR